MKRETKWIMAACMLAAFGVWTAAVCLVDVRAIGPMESSAGLAGINGFFHRFTGAHMVLYTITDWLGLVPFAVAAGFALLGLQQWILRKKLQAVDYDLRLLGVFYLAVIAAYAFFEEVVVNYRPVLIDGALEASYPSSTTLLVLCVMSTAMMQLRHRIRNRLCSRVAETMMGLFTAFMVVSRLISGVHWMTDIIGGVLLSTGLVLLYDAAVQHKCK